MKYWRVGKTNGIADCDIKYLPGCPELVEGSERVTPPKIR
jgi:hypothetical protein